MATVYSKCYEALSEWCTDNEFELRAERATRADGSLPDKYVLYSVISDPDVEHYDNKMKYRQYRVQIDIVVNRRDFASLPSMQRQVEDDLIEYGFFPQGNYRMQFDDSVGLAYIQKDYFIRMRGDELGTD